MSNRADAETGAARRRVVVVGGGIAGMAAAHRLIELSHQRRQPIHLQLLEASERLGGSIATEHADGFLIESGPDSFLSEKPWALALCQRLGVTDQLIGTREEFRRTYVVHAGQLHPLPDGFLLLAPTQFWPLLSSRLFSWPGKLRMGLDLLLPRATHCRDESLTSFVTRRLGREALERVAQPLVGGIYTADPDRLSLAATMPRFLEMERRYRSIIWAMWRQRRRAAAHPGATSGARWSLFVTFLGGMQALVDLLAQRLPEGAVRLRAPVTALRRGLDGTWVVNDEVACDAVILATPALLSARMVRDLDPALSSELAAISYTSSATVTLAYRREDIPHPLDGFGFVVPNIERRSIVACTLSSIKYRGRAPAPFVLLRAFIGGALQERLLDLDDAAMEGQVRQELRDLLGIIADPILRRVARHPQAMPQYDVGHLDRIDRITRRLAPLPGLLLAGSAYRGVGIPDCIHSGEDAAEAVMQALDREFNER